MPFGRAGVGHGLHHHVLGQKRPRELLAMAADLAQASGQLFPRRAQSRIGFVFRQ